MRAVFCPYLIDKKLKLTPKLFDPTPGTNEISMMRAEFMGVHGCKKKAKELENSKKTFKGFCAINAGIIRELGHEAVDSRQHFPGHAHIAMDAPVKGLSGAEPLSAEETKIYQDRKKLLEKNSRYINDPDHESFDWKGSRLF